MSGVRMFVTTWKPLFISPQCFFSSEPGGADNSLLPGPGLSPPLSFSHPHTATPIVPSIGQSIYKTIQLRVGSLGWHGWHKLLISSPLLQCYTLTNLSQHFLYQIKYDYSLIIWLHWYLSNYFHIIISGILRHRLLSGR